MKRLAVSLITVLLATVATAACHKKPPVPMPAPPPAIQPIPAAATTPTPTPRPPDPPTVPADTPIRSTNLLPWDEKAIEEINGPNSPLKPIFFGLDSDEIDDASRKILAADAEILKQYRTWVITVEGHCDERGSAEYNLALGDRRALAAKSYLVSLGVPAGRLRTVSYGREFPFDPEHSEAAGIEPVDDPTQDNVVLREVQRGYYLKGILLRPSRVIVGRLQGHNEEPGPDEKS